MTCKSGKSICVRMHDFNKRYKNIKILTLNVFLFVYVTVILRSSHLNPVACLSACLFPQRPTNPNPNPVRKNHACETCGKAFRDVYHLNRHRLSHSDEKPFSCPICQQRFKRKDRMSHHVRSHQGGVEKPYVCPHCGKAFSR